MIRQIKDNDIEDVLQIWLDASISAHSFISEEFWRENLTVMREVYLPASTTYVYEAAGAIQGFISLDDTTVAALFVATQFQGKGIGSALVDFIKTKFETLELAVYEKNSKSTKFYIDRYFRPILRRVDVATGEMEVLMRFERSDQKNGATH